MPRYIDADKLMQSCCEDCGEKYNDNRCNSNCNLVNKVNSISTTDVQPVVHGKWLNTRDINKLKCSNCEIIHFICQYPHGQINFCPNCGARMDLGGEK